MSRVANNPVAVPSGVEIKLNQSSLSVKGSKGTLDLSIHNLVEISFDDGTLTFAARNSSKESRAMSGTFRSLVNNMVVGVDKGFEKKLVLNGVGYRAKAAGKNLKSYVGFSHPVDYKLPEGVTANAQSD